MALKVTPPIVKEEGAERSLSQRGWNSRSCRISHLQTWVFWIKLSLTPLDRTSIDGTHNGEERWKRNGIKEVCDDLRDSQRKDELIMGSSVFIDIYNRCFKVRGKIDGEILHQRQKKMSTRLDDGVIVWQSSKIKSHYHVKKVRAFSKTQARGL